MNVFTKVRAAASIDVSWRARVSTGPSAALPAPPFRRSLGAFGRGKRI
jgi:hypothetical protein